MSELNYCRFCNCKTVTDTCKTCQQAVDAERERIIKLLENSLIAVAWEGIFWNKETMGESFGVDVQDIIALIKGEK
jgi:hypothetical protein